MALETETLLSYNTGFLPTTTEKTLVCVTVGMCRSGQRFFSGVGTVPPDQHITAEPHRAGCCANHWLHKTCNARYTQCCEHMQCQASHCSCKQKGLDEIIFPSIMLISYWELSHHHLPSTNTKGNHDEALKFGPVKLG